MVCLNFKIKERNVLNERNNCWMKCFPIRRKTNKSKELQFLLNFYELYLMMKGSDEGRER